MTDIYFQLRRDIESALHPKGMSVHSGKFTTRIDLVQRLLKERDQLLHERDCWKAGTQIVIDGGLRDRVAESLHRRLTGKEDTSHD